MKARLIIMLVPAAIALSACATHEQRPVGNLADGTFRQDIGNPLPRNINMLNCPVH